MFRDLSNLSIVSKRRFPRYCLAPPTTISSIAKIRKTIIPTSTDWANVNFNDGLCLVEGKLAELVYPELWEGCVGAWTHKLDQHAWDYSGNGNHGTRKNEVADHPDGWDFSTATNEIDCGSIIGKYDDFDISCWARPSSGARPVYTRGQDAYGSGWSVTLNYQSDGKFGFHIVYVFQSTCITNNSFDINKWHHVHCRHIEGSKLVVWVNGVQENSTNLSPQGGLRNSTKGFRFADTPGPTGSHWDGYIEDLRIYVNRQLSLPEIQTLAQRRNIAYECRV